MNNLPSRSSDYIQYLPAILQADPFLQRFLLAFEQILTGIPTSAGQCPGLLEKKSSVGLETVLDEIQTYFNPQQTPAEFLPWLAGWVALSLRDDWDEKTKRAFVQQIVPLYQLRGTREGLKRILSLYLRSASISDKVDIFEAAGFPPHYFQVQLTLPRAKQSDYWRQVRIARAIIEQEKPAHTYYALRILTPTMRLTGNRYAFQRSTAATTVVSVEVRANAQQTTPIPLRVSLKAAGIVDPLATAIAQVSTSKAAFLTSPTSLPDQLVMPTTRLTGNRYAFQRPTTATVVSVEVQANSQQMAAIPLRVSIKAAGIIDPLAIAIAQVSTSTAAFLTSPTSLPNQFASSNTWYVLIDNLSSVSFRGTLTVKAATILLLSGAVDVEPGLRLFKPQANGSITHASSNTWYVLIDNLSSVSFRGTLTVKAATVPLLSGAVEVEPGLRLFKPQANGSITDGNTLLGTQVGEN